jgi:excisionase family DNA binding protein
MPGGLESVRFTTRSCMSAEFARLLRVKEVVEVTGLGRSTVYSLLEDGTLPGIRMPGTEAWRVDPADLRAFLDRGRTGGAAARGAV